MPGSSPIIQDELPSIIRDLRTPAGPDPRFGTKEAIAANRDLFTRRVHDTWKLLHNRSIEEMLQIEALLNSVAKQYPPDFAAFLKYLELIWRKVNDAIVWTMYNMQGHAIRRLCLRKARPALSECNPNTIVPLLNELNADPLTIAIWSDATTCVDVGDVVSRSFSGKPSGILEVKSGPVNQAILDLLETAKLDSDFLKGLETIAETYGQSAVKQVGRVLRQAETSSRVTEILNTDKGIDQYHGEPIQVFQSNTDDRDYDDQLASCIAASDKEPVLECVDGCLWIFIDQDPEKSHRDLILEFSSRLYRDNPSMREWNRDRYGLGHLGEVVPADACLSEPYALPIFYRRLGEDCIQQLLLGKLKHRVLLHLDWQAYERLFPKLGARLTWSTVKRARAQSAVPHEKKTVVVGNRIPILSLDTGETLAGHAKMYRVFFEGILPSVVVAQYVEMLRAHPSATT